MADHGNSNPDQQNELMFMQLVMMFQGMALQNLGKVMNPVTNQIERNLEQAKNMIDILGMLDVKTKGNLNDNEHKLLEHALFELRMNYVDEIKKGDGGEAEEQADESSEQALNEEAEEQADESSEQTIDGEPAAEDDTPTEGAEDAEDEEKSVD